MPQFSVVMLVLWLLGFLSLQAACGSEAVPTVWEERVKEHLTPLEVRKSVVLDGRHPRVLKVLDSVIVRLLSVIFQKSW